jgi:hypothetical protein
MMGAMTSATVTSGPDARRAESHDGLMHFFGPRNPLIGVDRQLFKAACTSRTAVAAKSLTLVRSHAGNELREILKHQACG